MNRGFAVYLAVLAWSAACVPVIALATERKPNFIIFLTDDQGYNDVGCFGSPNIKTPNFDRMAKEGMRFTDAYVASPVCGPSRAGLMTGCYPIRIAEPHNRKNLHSIPHTREITIAEVLKPAGYISAVIGKWHLAGGYKVKADYPPELMPRGQGFDYFHGTPLHNGTRKVTPKPSRVQIMRNDRVLVQDLDQKGMDHLTQDYTREAKRFITENKDRPFFLYLAHNMPHVPLGASEAFRGKSAGGLYGDVIEELDWSLGEVLKTLKQLGLDENTLVVFFSDNGPWVEDYLKGYYGRADPLRGSKMKSWEGGPRVPCIIRWPGKVRAGKASNAIVTTMDLMPTFARLAGAALPDDRALDGCDLYPLLTRATETAPRDYYFYYCYTHLHAVRDERWKLVLPRKASPKWMDWWARMIDEVKEIELYDLHADLGEKTNVAARHPEVVERLLKQIQWARTELGDCDRIGAGARFFDRDEKRPDIARCIASRNDGNPSGRTTKGKRQ